IGKAKVRREGKDLTIISYGTAVHWSLLAAKELEKDGFSVEVVDLRSLIPWDKETVAKSVKKTNRVLIAHEDRLTGGFGGEIAAFIVSELFQYLDAPVKRVGSKEVPVGFAKSYEKETILNTEDVLREARIIINY
ncbi:MAG TPA: transketolase C-terminal domain-containing protein, partial [Candidatus Kapabacteria bacterium]|nr:transketolase C-terminal domain-containing protein [Candidatus Kapabacteria bacterium]